MKYCLAFACIGAGIGLAAPMASAQVAPPIEDVVIQGEILNRTIEEAAGATTARGDAAANEIDGEAGIYVLTVNEIFQVSGGAGLGYTDNPTRTATDPGGAWYAELGAGLGVATRLGGAVDFGLSANLGAREFLEGDDGGPSSRSLSATMSVGAPLVGPVYGSLVAFGGTSYEDDFDDNTGFYGLAANVSTSFPLSRKLLVRPGIGLTQQWSDVSENNSFTATLSADVIHVFSPKLVALLRLSASQRAYEDFYEDVTFVEREDTLYGLSASLVYRPTKALALAAGVTYEDQDSTFFLSEFEALDAAATVSLRQTF